MPAPQLSDLALDLIDDPDTELRKDYDYEQLRSLADSIAAVGLLQPIGVVPHGSAGRYQRVWGGRRLAAHRLLNLPTIRAIVLDPETDQLTGAITENIHRADLTPLEEAAAVQAALGLGLSEHDLATRWRRSPQWLRDRLSLLSWPDDIRDAIHQRRIPLAVADWLRRVDNNEYRAYLLDAAVSGGCTATVAQQWVLDYEIHRPRILQNQAVVAELAARKPSYQVLIPCDGCARPTDITTLKTYRICEDCQADVEAARKTLA